MTNLTLGRVVSYAGLATAIGAVTLITGALIAVKAVPPDFRDKLLCTAGYIDLAGQTCLAEQAAAAQAEADAAAAKARQEAQAQVQAANEARELAEHALVGRMVFEEGPEVGGLTIVVGTTYVDHASRSGFVRSICWGIHDRGGLDPRITLAQLTAGGAPEAVDVDAYERSALNVDMQAIEAARAACPWPKVS